MKPTREPARINRIQGSQLEIRKEQRSPRISDGEAMIPIISAHYGFAAAGSPAAFPRSRRIQQIQEPAADVPSPTGIRIRPRPPRKRITFASNLRAVVRMAAHTLPSGSMALMP